MIFNIIILLNVVQGVRTGEAGEATASSKFRGLLKQNFSDIMIY